MLLGWLFLFSFPFLCYFTAIFFFLSFQNCSFLASAFHLPLFALILSQMLLQRELMETTFYRRAISNTDKANGNAVSTETMLVIVDNHLKTFLIDISLLWLHLYCGLDHIITHWLFHIASYLLFPTLVLWQYLVFFLWASNFLHLSKSIFILFVRFFPLSLSVAVITSA